MPRYKEKRAETIRSRINHPAPYIISTPTNTKMNIRIKGTGNEVVIARFEFKIATTKTTEIIFYSEYDDIIPAYLNHCTREQIVPEPVTQCKRRFLSDSSNEYTQIYPVYRKQ